MRMRAVDGRGGARYTSGFSVADRVNQCPNAGTDTRIESNREGSNSDASGAQSAFGRRTRGDLYGQAAD
jgi:hypothetical protein